MLRITIIQLSWVLAIMAMSVSISAQNKVVVIPMLGDEAPSSKAVFVTQDTHFATFTGGPGGACDIP